MIIPAWRRSIRTRIVPLLLVFAAALGATRSVPCQNNIGSSSAKEQQISVVADFGKAEYYPLVKERIGLFQENEALLSQEQFNENLVLLNDLPDTTFRFLGRFDNDVPFNTPPQVFKEDGVVGTHTNRPIDDALDFMRKKRILPILSLYGTPSPFASPDGVRFLPVDMEGYASAMSQLAGKYEQDGPLVWEIWNEPNLKGFLNSTNKVTDYFTIYRSTASAIHTQHPDILIAGPSFSDEATPPLFQEFVARYLQEEPKDHTLLLDYFSFHNYRTAEAAEVKLAMVRNAVQDKFNTTPFMITEYENFHPSASFEIKKIREKTEGAVQFLNHVEMLMRNTDVATISWNRFMTNKPAAMRSNPGGMVSYEGDKRAIFNAYELFGWLPVDRSHVDIAGNTSVHAMAGADVHNVGLLLWNTSNVTENVAVDLRNLPSAIKPGRNLRVFRIDAQHASGGEGAPASLESEAVRTIDGPNISLKLPVPGPGIVYLQESDGSEIFLRAREGLRTAKYIRTWQWCPRKDVGSAFVSTGDYGTVDQQAWTMRVGTATPDGQGIAGVTFDAAPHALWVSFSSKDVNARLSKEKLIALRIDYLSGQESLKSVLIHGKYFDARRQHELPWGRGGAAADVVLDRGEAVGSGKLFQVDIDKEAPPSWDNSKRRILVTAWTDATGIGSQSVILLSDRAER